MLKTRVFSAIVLVLLLGAGLYYGGLLWWVLLLFISIVGYHEFCMAIRKIPVGEKYEIALPEIVGYLCTVFYYLLILVNPKPEYMLYTLVGVIIVHMVLFVALFPEYDNAKLIQTCFGFLYIPFMISFLFLLRRRDNGITEILLVVIASWICDTFAYFTGRAFGRHKLAPVLSPHKSIEGAVGGTVASMLVGAFFTFITKGNVLLYATMTGVGAVVSQFGDLFASGIKRNQGIKDYGSVIPGHGGILDRFDSVIITAPVIYILVNMLL